MAESVADDPKLAPLWDVGQNPQPASKMEARSFRSAVWRCASGHTDAAVDGVVPEGNLRALAQAQQDARRCNGGHPPLRDAQVQGQGRTDLPRDSRRQLGVKPVERALATAS